MLSARRADHWLMGADELVLSCIGSGIWESRPCTLLEHEELELALMAE